MPQQIEIHRYKKLDSADHNDGIHFEVTDFTGEKTYILLPMATCWSLLENLKRELFGVCGFTSSDSCNIFGCKDHQTIKPLTAIDKWTAPDV